MIIQAVSSSKWLNWSEVLTYIAAQLNSPQADTTLSGMQSRVEVGCLVPVDSLLGVWAIISLLI